MSVCTESAENGIPRLRSGRDRPFTIQTGRLVLTLIRPPPSSASGSTSERSPAVEAGLKDNRGRCVGRYKKVLARSALLTRARKPYGRWTGNKILAAGAPPPSAGGVPTSSFGATGQHRKGENRVLTREGEADTPAWQEMVNQKRLRKRVKEILEEKKRRQAAP